MKTRDLILLIGGASFLVLVTLLSLLLADRFQVRGCGCPRVVSHNFVVVFIILSVIFVSSLLYYLFSLKINEKQKIIVKNIEILYSILDKDEKKVIQKLIDNQGSVGQSQISKMYDKIKAHRIIKKLESKNMINVIKKGKTNKIELKKELQEELVK